MLWYCNHFFFCCEDWLYLEVSLLFWDGDWLKLLFVIIVFGEFDVLKSEGEVFGKKFMDVGVKVDVYVLKGQLYFFLVMDGVLQVGCDVIMYFCQGMLKLYDEGSKIMNGINGVNG